MSGLAQPSGALARALRSGGRVIQRTGLPLVRLEAELFCEEARQRTGLDDFGDPRFREPLARLIADFDGDAQLSLLGRIAARQDVIRLLANRLRMEWDRKRHPEIAFQPVRGPLFVTGLPRTGTTLLHGLLAQDPSHRAPLSWEMMFPSPPPERIHHHHDPRIAAAERQLRWFHRLNPGFRRIHELAARLPEECLIITSHAFLSFQFQTSHHVPAYQAWLETQNLVPAYEAHRRFLQNLQWRWRGERWVLKAPAHLFGIRALLDVYPDAGVILTHRDPLEVVGSLASLTTALRSTFSDDVDPERVGPEMTRRWADGLARALRDRDDGLVPADRFFDVRYVDLVRDPIGTVRSIYDHYGIRFTPAAEERMRRFLARHPKDKHGRHSYTLAEFGLAADEEAARYRTYRERFGL
jgi:Sulfotransferase family